MKSITEQYGPWALITGASAGIGEEFARQLAQKGMNLFLVARSKEKLDELASELEQQYAVEVKPIQADLSSENFLEEINRETNDYDIGLLVNNAGREDSDHFLKITADQHLQTLHLNTRAPLLLMHHYGNKMKDRERSGIINISSIVAFHGVPYIANYGATKAYDLILSEGVAAELKKHRIDVLAVAPGFTYTDFANVYDFKGIPIKPMPVKQVVKSALKTLGKNGISIPGAINKFLYYNSKYFLSRRMSTRSFGLVFRHILRKVL